MFIDVQKETLQSEPRHLNDNCNTIILRLMHEVR
jgi:hypothetical protein